MLITEETRGLLNNLIAYSFEANAVADNCAYNLAYYMYPNIEKIVHKSFAHKFPVLADVISDLMIELDSRPVRKDIGGHEEDYEGNLEKVFLTILGLCTEYRSKIVEVIEVAELNEDYEVKIRLEEFLVGFEPYRKQASVWYEYSKRYNGDYKSFDVHFKEFTTFIQVD